MPGSLTRALLAAVLLGGATACPATADTPPPFQITLKDHRFTPTEIHVPAAQPVFLDITNADATADEFEMRQLAIEKVIAGGATARVRLRPMAPGRYTVIGEYHEATAQGTIVAEPAGASAPKP